MNKVLLIVRDGWGYTEDVEGNAIKAANTPFVESRDPGRAIHTPHWFLCTPRTQTSGCVPCEEDRRIAAFPG